MKKNTHPKYFVNATITCSCGNTILTGATREKISTELCSACHPFYTGQQKLIDTAKRVDKFEERRKKAQEMKQKKVDDKLKRVVDESKETKEPSVEKTNAKKTTPKTTTPKKNAAPKSIKKTPKKTKK